jgi:hypothetical protein
MAAHWRLKISDLSHKKDPAPAGRFVGIQKFAQKRCFGVSGKIKPTDI